MTTLSAILGVLAALLLIPVVVLLVQVLLALPARRPRPLPPGRRPVARILIPAHNEAAVIADTLHSVIPQLAMDDRILVVADNCTDDTAAIARALGAEVAERTDPERRGKDHALDFGVRRLRDCPPEVVIVIDADCQVLPGTIDRLARVCAETSRPVQALYLMRSPEAARPKTRLAEFAWIVKNQIRPLGNLRLGLPGQLMGTGMAFPWTAINGVTLVSGYLAEDIKFGVDLALAGYPPVFCPDATVTSFFPGDRAAERTQRTRWEHGHLDVIRREFPRLLAGAIRRKDIGLLGMAMDLAMPPLSLLALMVIVIGSLNLAVFLAAGIVWPLGLSAVTLGLFAAAIIIAWYGWGREVVSFLSLWMTPYYLISKVPLYLRFLIKRQSTWIKTGRD